MASEVELATLGASILALLRRDGARITQEGALSVVEQGIPEGGTLLAVPMRMQWQGLHIIQANEVGQWIQVGPIRPRVKLMIQNRGNGAVPNAGNIFYADRQMTGATDGIRILPDGHLWDENGAHQGELWVLGDTVATVISIIEWGIAPVTSI